MTELQQNRYDRLLRRVGDLKGPGSKVNDVLEELFPTIDVENVPGELLWLMGTRLCQGGGIVAGVAAVRSKMQVFNPVGSGKLVTITDVHAGVVGNTTTMRWGIGVTALTTENNSEVFRDTRELPPTAPTAQVRTETSATLSTGTSQTRQLQNQDLHLFDPNGLAVLAPGTGFEIGVSTNDIDLLVGFMWRERQAEPSELLF